MKITLLNEDGTSKQLDLLSIFSIGSNSFIINTNNEVDPNGLTILHVSKIVNDKLVSVDDDNDWNSVKNIMRSIISNSGDVIEYLPVIESISASNNFSRDISVEKSALTVLAKDYESKKPASPEPVDNVPVMENAPQADPYSSPVFAQGGAMDPSVGNTVAPGINEVTQDSAPINPIMNGGVDFQQVNGLPSNPVDLIDNNGMNQEVNNIGDQVNQFVDNGYIQGMEPNQPMMNNNVMNGSSVTDALASLPADATDKQIIDIGCERISSEINNLINYILSKRIAELDMREQALANKEMEIKNLENAVQFKLASANQQPMMNNNMMMNQQPMQQPMNMMQPQDMGMQMMQPQQPMPQQPMNNMMNGGMQFNSPMGMGQPEGQQS